VAGEEEHPCQKIEGGIEEGTILQPKGPEPKGHPLKGHRPGNTQGKDRREGIESLTQESRSNEHSVLEIIQMSPGGGIPERKKDTINKGPERIHVCRGVIQIDIEGLKEDKSPLFEIKDHIMMKEGKIRMVEERQERALIQDTSRDIDKWWTVRQGSQVIGNLVEITVQTVVGKC
jgi:hypothetical protein